MPGVGGRESGVGSGAPRPARRGSGSISGPPTPPGANDSARWPADLSESLADLARRRPNLAFDPRWYASLPSTMDAVSAAAERGAAAGLVVLADEQVAGRGRRGRAWSSPSGAGLYFSYLARPARGFDVLTLAAGVAVRAGILAATGLAADLKWPNDLLVGGKKLAGLLAEAARVGTPEASVAIGVGVNLRPATHPAEVAMRATSLEAALGRAVDRGAILAAVLEHLADTLASLEAGDAGAILHAWRAASPSGVGTPVEWSDPSGPRRGVTAGIDDRGALLIRTTAGTERLIAGELQWHLRS